jgi:hypothetical protein
MRERMQTANCSVLVRWWRRGEELKERKKERCPLEGTMAAYKQLGMQGILTPPVQHSMLPSVKVSSE